MNGRQLVRAIEKYRELCDDAGEKGEELPTIEAAISLMDQKRILRHYGATKSGEVTTGDVLQGAFDALNDAVDELNSAQTAFDSNLDIIEYIANGLANSETVQRQLAAAAPEAPMSEPDEDEDREGPVNADASRGGGGDEGG